MTPSLCRKFRRLKGFIYDFDGVMTDNRVWVLEDGREGVFCHRGDGWAVGQFAKMGLIQAILSTESNPVVAQRAKKLKLPVLHGLEDKEKALLSWAQRERWDLKHMAYVGNDENDLGAMRHMGMVLAPADAHPCVLNKADWVARSAGGFGVLRELLDHLRTARA